MNLIQEYSIKVIIFTFCLAFALESAVLIFMLLTSKNTLNKIYDSTIEKSENKTTELTISLKTVTINFINKLIIDLKLIARNTYLYDIKNNSNDKNSFNMKSKIFSNNNKLKIISKTENELYNNSIFGKLYNNNTKRLEYLDYYKNLYSNAYSNDIILNNLSMVHEELNIMNYINFTKFTNIENLSDEDIKRLQFLLTLFKSIYIKMFISKKSLMSLLHLLILSEKELIIYPPEDPTKLNLYKYIYLNPYSRCSYNATYVGNYPFCVYNSSINSQSNSSYIIVLNEDLNIYGVFSAVCIRFPYIKEKPDESLICAEIDFVEMLKSMNFKSGKNFEFGVFKTLKLLLNESYILEDIIVIYNKNDEISLDEISTVYNSSNSTPSQFILGEGRISIGIDYLSMFHYIYYNTTIIIKEHPELNYDISKLEEEFNFIKRKLIDFDEMPTNNKSKNYSFTFERTVCKKELIGDEYECIIDEAEMIISPLIMSFNDVDENFLDKDEVKVDHYSNLFIYTILKKNPEINKSKINKMLVAKLTRIIIFYFFITVIIFCFFILFLNIISEYSFKSVNILIEDINKINIDDEKREISYLEEDKSFTANNEMVNLKGLYETMRNSLIIKQVFEKEMYLRKHNIEFYKLIQDLKIRNIMEICNSYLAYFHFNNKIYNISENEFHSTMNFIQENEVKLKSGGVNEFDDKLKDAIKRSSTVSYLNEYSKFENIDENMINTIYIKIFKQRFIYLYAMTKFKLGSEINSDKNNAGPTNKNKAKNNKDKMNNYFKDAIKYFQECKNINSLLGINQIKIIYSLIMISKCYVHLNDYKNAITNINEALSLYFEFSQTFKDLHSKIYNAKVMLSVESNIFHYILFTISRISTSFNKQCASNWINLKIFETSPFILSNIHYHAGISLHTFFDKNRTRMNKYDPNFYKNAKLLKEFEKIKKYYGKIVSRIHKKTASNINKTMTSEKIDESHYTSRNRTPTITESVTDRSRVSSNLKKEMTTSKVSAAFQRNRRLNKVVTFCMSEKILEKLNGQEFKDVLIKYFQKYFVMNEFDKFSFIQFADNGKKTAFFKPEPLNYFLVKFQKTKGTFELSDSFSTTNSSIFVELYNILDSIIKNYSQIEETDNIIIIFMDSEDIRFSSIDDCLNIVEDLNKKNASLYFCTYDNKIMEEKVNNVQSFLNGLIEGNFYQIKNYQQIKQIFMNISTVESQSNFFSFDYDVFEMSI